MKTLNPEIFFWKYAKGYDAAQIAYRFGMSLAELDEILDCENFFEKKIIKFKRWANIRTPKEIISTMGCTKLFGDGKSSFPERLNHMKKTNQLI